jgi:hypothetical protein
LILHFYIASRFQEVSETAEERSANEVTFIRTDAEVEEIDEKLLELIEE